MFEQVERFKVTFFRLQFYLILIFSMKKTDEITLNFLLLPLSIGLFNCDFSWVFIDLNKISTGFFELFLMIFLYFLDTPDTRPPLCHVDQFSFLIDGMESFSESVSFCH